MRSMRRRRPEIERLDIMCLLSGVAGAAVDAAIPGPLDLSGAVHGSYREKGIETASHGSGSISPLGHVKDIGKALLIDGSGTETMSTRRGKLFVELHVRPTEAGFAGTYTITGGTRAYEGETGTGVVAVTFVGSMSHGHYTTTYS